jgi:hypothetical protein
LPAQPQTIPTPEEFAGFRMGTEGRLLRWDKIVDYFEVVARASDRVHLEELGKSTLGNPFIMATISSPRNLARLEAIRATQRSFAYPAELNEERAQELARNSPAVLMITCSIHATEIGCNQMVSEILHRVATDDSPWMRFVLDNVVLLYVPSFNPDGQTMTVNWYNRWRGTEYERAQLPWLYHHYVGHDNNRDAFMLTQVESRLVTQQLYQRWFPQVFLDQHQMGLTEARIFVPPFRNPLNPNVDPLIWAENALLGMAMFTALHQEGLAGTTYDQYYTAWWQGNFSSQVWWHNIVGLLTEVASTWLATSTEQEEAELWQPYRPPRDFQQYLAELAKQPTKPLPPPRDTVPRNNYPRPWLGGKWTLRDIIDYELVSTYALIDAVARHRERLILNQVRMGRNAIARGRDGNPYAFIFSPSQHDPGALRRLLELLHFAGVELHRAEAAFRAQDREFPAGTYVLLMAQPYRAFVKDILERQDHPDSARMPPGAVADRPYDVTAWTLPLQMGLQVVEIAKPFEAKLTRLEELPPLAGTLVQRGAQGRYGYLVRPEPDNKAVLTNRLLKAGAQVSWLTEAIEVGGQQYPAGTMLIERAASARVEEMVRALGLTGEELTAPVTAPRLRLQTPRVGLYQPWTASMDEGWTRWLLERYEFEYTALHNADLQSGGLRQKFDVVILPGDRNNKSLREGNQLPWTPPEYKGGIGEEGLRALREFIAAGGTVVASDQSTELLLESLALPVKSALKGVERSAFSCPGSLLRVLVDPQHPVGYGMQAEATAVFSNSAVFDLAAGFSYTDLRVIARYPGTNPLQSGWIRGPEHLFDRIAAAEVQYESGRVILFGFRPHFRAQPDNTFKLLFNALHYAAAAKR